MAPPPSTSVNAMTEWLTPEARPDHIEKLIKGVERYDPAQVQVLEDYLAQQMSEVFYDALANFATLKLYQFNPDLVPLASETPANPTEAIHDAITIKILLLSIAHRPFESDFSLGFALCGDRRSPLVTPAATLNLFNHLSRLSLLMHSRQFAAFWSLVRSPELEGLTAFMAEIRGFDALVRAAIAQSVSRCFRSISQGRLAQYTGLASESDVREWSQGQGWSVDGDRILIPENSENSPKKETVIREVTQFEDLQRVLLKSAA